MSEVTLEASGGARRRTHHGHCAGTQKRDFHLLAMACKVAKLSRGFLGYPGVVEYRLRLIPPASDTAPPMHDLVSVNPQLEPNDVTALDARGKRHRYPM